MDALHRSKGNLFSLNYKYTTMLAYSRAPNVDLSTTEIFFCLNNICYKLQSSAKLHCPFFFF